MKKIFLTLTTILSASVLVFSVMSCASEQKTNQVNATAYQPEYASIGNAKPVWQEGNDTTKNLTLTFRQILDIKKVKSARIKLACSTNYRLLVNGQFVAHGPAVAAHGFYRVDDYDLAPYLKKGKNIVGIEVAGYNLPSYYLLDQPSFLQAEIKVNNKVVAETGKDFKAYNMGQRKQDVPKFSFQRPYAEYYILSPDYQQWATDLEWEDTSKEVKLAEMEPKTLITRRVHQPDYSLHDAKNIEKDMWKFDINSSGFLSMKVNVKEKSTLRVAFDEVVGSDGKIVLNRIWELKPYVTYELEPGEYTLETFEPYTILYAQTDVLEGDCVVEKMWMRDYCNSDVHAGTFEASDPRLNKIFEGARETYRQNSVDIFTDCPGRERAGWLCDSYFTSRVAVDLSGNTLVEKNFIENFLLPEKFKYLPDGMLPMCYPSDHTNGSYIPNWAMWFVAELEEYLQRSGDTKLIEQAKDRVYALLDFFKKYENSDGLLEKLESWVFVEWSAANSYVQDVNYPSNMLYAYILDVVSRLYSDPALHDKAENIKKIIRDQSYDGTFFCDNSIRQEDGSLVRTEHHTEACQYYAFYLKTATPELYPELWQKLRDEFGPKRNKVNPYPTVEYANAFIGNYLRFECLSQNDLSKQIIDESMDYFLPMVEQTGTLWENMGSNASCNHGFASHLAHVLYRDVLGFYDVDRVGKSLQVKILDTGIASCKGSLPVGNEKIDLVWVMKDGKIYYRLTTPPGWRISVESPLELIEQ